MNNKRFLNLLVISSIFFGQNIFSESLDIKIINNLPENLILSSLDLKLGKSISPESSKNIILNREQKNVSIQYIVSKSNVTTSFSSNKYLPIQEALENPYLNGSTEIIASKGLLGGVSFKIIYLDNKKTIRISSKDLNDWSKVLSLAKNAKPDEILYKAGKLAGFNFEKNVDLTGSTTLLDKDEFHKLYLVLKNWWSNNKAVWQKLEDCIKTVYKG